MRLQSCSLRVGFSTATLDVNQRLRKSPFSVENHMPIDPKTYLLIHVNRPGI